MNNEGQTTEEPMTTDPYITTLRLPRAYERPLKELAAADGRTVNSYISIILRRHIEQRGQARTSHARKD